MSLKSSYLNLLENESLYYIREAISISENPVLLYSAGKDSSVLLHLIKEETENPDLIIKTEKVSAEKAADKIIKTFFS